MSVRLSSPMLASLAMVAWAGAASAQTWTPEQQEIWKVEEHRSSTRSA